MAKNFMITLTKVEGQQFYLSGQEVSGEVRFTLTDAKHYDHVEIKLTGIAKVYWAEQRYVNNTSYREDFIAKEKYIDETKILWEKKQSPGGKIGPGDFSLPFQFTLPPNCQSSYPKGQLFCFMWIEYTLHAKIDTHKLLTVDPKYTLPIRVRKVTDINRADLMLPTHQSEHSLVGCFCCSAGEMQLTANVPRTGCCVGTNFPLTVNVENSSTRSFNLTASINRHLTLLASGHVKETGDCIVLVMSPLINPNSQYTWEVKDLLIPFDTVPTIEGSEIIKVEDYVYVNASISCSFDTSVRIPITIGNVPCSIEY